MTELKMVRKRREVCATVLGLVRRALERGEREAATSGGDRPDVAAIQTMLDLAQDRLTSDLDAYLQAARACESEKAASRRLRAHRDRALAKLRQDHLVFRSICSAIYGESASRRLGFPSRTPREPEELCRILQDVTRAFENPAFVREHPVPSYVRMDPAPWIRDVRSLVKEVEEWLLRVEESRQRLKLCQEARDQEQMVLDVSIGAGIQVLLAYFGHAGMEDEAKTLRKEVRKLR